MNSRDMPSDDVTAQCRDRAIGVIGGRSPVGRRVVRLLEADGWKVASFSREDIETSTTPDAVAAGQRISHWVYVAHIWTVADSFGVLERFGAKRLVALSSTSRFTKVDSSEPKDRELADRLATSEDRVLAWASKADVDCTILRPTLIYGGGDDRNISEIAALIRKIGFFPLLGPATGLRQPVHVDDVASACLGALFRRLPSTSYNISGAEVLPYRELVTRVYRAMGRTPRLLHVPRFVAVAGIHLLRLLPRFRTATTGMAERMMIDMIFDHSDATRDFDYAPRGFTLLPTDVGASAEDAA